MQDTETHADVLGSARPGKVTFVAVATGQNAANLPPILEAARAGDEVLWLESQEAREKSWSAGAREVLAGRQIRSLEPLKMPDEPDGVATVVREKLGGRHGETLVFVHNGGTKLTSLAIDRGMDGRKCPLLYGNLKPSELWMFPEGVEGPLLRRAYRRASMSLGEILASTGHRIRNLSGSAPGSLALRFWPGDDCLGVDPYGVDAEATAQAHAASSERELLKSAAGAGVANYRQALVGEPQRLRNWADHLLRCAPAATRESRRHPHLSAAVAAERQLESIFNAAANLAQDAARAPLPEIIPLGGRFERAVARRVRAWLEAHGEAAGVVEAWLNVDVAVRDRPGSYAEWDIVLVLSNALLLVLECKSFECTLEEIFARSLKLQLAATRLAEMTICFPVYTAFTGERWFVETLKKQTNVQEAKLRWAPFGLPAQPTEFVRGIGEAQVRETCPTFEESLTSMLKPYRPSEAERGEARAA